MKLLPSAGAVLLLGAGLYAMPTLPGGAPASCQVRVEACGRIAELCLAGACGPQSQDRAQALFAEATDCQEPAVLETEGVCPPRPIHAQR